MKMVGNLYGLFPFKYFSCPEGIFNINVHKKKYELHCQRVILLKKSLFLELDVINEFYLKIEKKSKKLVNRIPYIDDYGLLLNKEFFEKELSKSSMKNLLYGLVSEYYCLSIIIDENYDGESKNIIEYLNVNWNENKRIIFKEVFFRVVKVFYENVMIYRAPYIEIIDISEYYVGWICMYFTDEKQKIITKTLPFEFDCWSPQPNIITKDLIEVSRAYEALFMAKAKIYLRHKSFTMSIIYSVIALEMIVPKFINNYFKYKGIDSDTLNDFNGKFGLSIRVKALLKIILPSYVHGLLKNVGKTIKFRNKIMHEGLTDEFFTNNQEVKEMIEDCEMLIRHLERNMKLD